MNPASYPSEATDTPDAVLVGRVVAFDDRRSLATLIGRHSGMLRRVLLRMTRGDAALADDLAQTTWIKAYQSLAQFRSDARLRTWLYRIAFNEFLQHQRRAGVRLVAASGGGEDEFEGDDSAFLADVADASLPELALDLARALDSLPEEERLAVLACYHAEMSHSEAARLLHCPLGTLKTRVARGRARLRAALSVWRPHALENLA